MPGPELLLGILSRGRLPSLRRCVNSAIALAGAPITTFVFFDDDAVCANSYLPPQGVYSEILYPRHYYVRALNAAYRKLRDNGADIIAFVNNDCEFIKPDWVVKGKEALFKTFPDGMGLLEMSDDAGKCSHFITRVLFVEEFLEGRLVCEEYTQYYSDSELLHTVEEKLKRYSHILDLNGLVPWIIQHTTYDSVHIEGKRWFKKDKETYFRRNIASDGALERG